MTFAAFANNINSLMASKLVTVLMFIDKLSMYHIMKTTIIATKRLLIDIEVVEDSSDHNKNIIGFIRSLTILFGALIKQRRFSVLDHCKKVFIVVWCYLERDSGKKDLLI